MPTLKIEIVRWVVAAVVALAAHLGAAALALMHWPESSVENVAGALLVELAPLPAVAPVDSPDLARGPVAPNASLMRETVRERAEPDESALPAEPSPAQEPDVAMPVERSALKVQPEEKAERQEEHEKQDAAAALATAPPRVDAQPLPKSAPPSPGQAASLTRKQATWQQAIVEHLNKHKRYPEAARSRHAQGTAVVAFKLDRAGRVISSKVTRSSGSVHLDREALSVLERASPLPAPPAHLSGSALEFVLPINFSIR